MINVFFHNFANLPRTSKHYTKQCIFENIFRATCLHHCKNYNHNFVFLETYFSQMWIHNQNLERSFPKFDMLKKKKWATQQENHMLSKHMIIIFFRNNFISWDFLGFRQGRVCHRFWVSKSMLDTSCFFVCFFHFNPFFQKSVKCLIKRSRDGGKQTNSKNCSRNTETENFCLT